MFSTKATLCFALQLTLCATSAWSRTELNFDFGWRHRLGATRKPSPPPAPTPPVGCTGKYAFRSTKVQCAGLSNHGAAKNAAECEAYCCGWALYHDYFRFGFTFANTAILLEYTCNNTRLHHITYELVRTTVIIHNISADFFNSTCFRLKGEGNRRVVSRVVGTHYNYY